ncbi:putative 3 -5 exonuclease protein [Eutypa lata UCREL1]|uniref:Putative 3-5 exonuclease protein n=1 Tax=Eutypa lata (strain UCR-EL1) TaxID=1287681 RepID=M7SK88_EUTLA|nr:putative 3 -5 exonuclease protein [Eutypa lata UCREL1]
MDVATGNNGLVDTKTAVAEIVDSLDGLPTVPPSLYIDLEGEHLSRHGTLDILQLHVLPSDQTYLIDIKVLGHNAFNTPGTCGLTFKDLLESPDIPTVFFDVRRDSDALYSHFQIKLAGVQDLQLMELATRPFASKKFVCGLGKCVERDVPMTFPEMTAWKADKEKGVSLFDPKRGGSYKVFSERPLRKEIQEYCIQDAKYLPHLWSNYDKKLTPTWKINVCEATKARVAESQTQSFDPDGKHMAMAPVGWQWL